MRMRLRQPIVVMLLFLSTAYAAVWLPEAKRAYIDQCAGSLTSQGLPAKAAGPYCSCAADGLEKEFGKEGFSREEFRKLMNAQPNAQGDVYDKRLYAIFNACAAYLPRSK